MATRPTRMMILKEKRSFNRLDTPPKLGLQFLNAYWQHGSTTLFCTRKESRLHSGQYE